MSAWPPGPDREDEIRADAERVVLGRVTEECRLRAGEQANGEAMAALERFHDWLARLSPTDEQESPTGVSAWPIPDEVVESFANIMGGSMRDARGFLEAHRLVAVPTESDTNDPVHESVWEYLTHDNEWRRALCGAPGPAKIAARKQRGPAFGPQIREVHYFRIPGQPITVDKEESGPV